MRTNVGPQSAKSVGDTLAAGSNCRTRALRAGSLAHSREHLPYASPGRGALPVAGGRQRPVPTDPAAPSQSDSLGQERPDLEVSSSHLSVPILSFVCRSKGSRPRLRVWALTVRVEPVVRAASRGCPSSNDAFIASTRAVPPSPPRHRAWPRRAHRHRTWRALRELHGSRGSARLVLSGWPNGPFAPDSLHKHDKQHDDKQHDDRV
jgi:hypothetical protein